MNDLIWQMHTNLVRDVQRTFDLQPSKKLVAALYPHASDATQANVLASLLA